MFCPLPNVELVYYAEEGCSMKRDESQPGVHPDPVPDEESNPATKPAPTQHPDPAPEEDDKESK